MGHEDFPFLKLLKDPCQLCCGDPAFYLSADPDGDLDKGSPTNGDPCISGLVRLKSHKK